MGNMTDFWRSGYIEDVVNNHIDIPELTLDGNRMTRVDDYDHVLNYPYNKGSHFVDYASQDNEYTYDQNGNMTKDLNRNISSIQYNLLNLPQNMTYSNNKSTTYVYDATGRKLQVEYVNPATTFDYCGNMIYVNGTHGLDMYDYGARFYDPGICRFTTMDPMCEKYYHLSPYIYCGNNPMNAIDMKGDTIIYIHDNTQYYYMMKGDASGFYDKQGNMLKNQNAYELSSALQEIQSGEMGYKLVNFLSNSTRNISIGIEKEALFIDKESKIEWNPSDFNAAGRDEYGHHDTPPFIALAHELFHAKDYIMHGNKGMGVWYKNLKGENVSMKEFYTCLNENLIRAEHGLPLRQYYSDKPYLPSYIPKSILPFSVLHSTSWK